MGLPDRPPLEFIGEMRTVFLKTRALPVLS